MCGSIMGPKLSICNIPLNGSISRVVYGALNHPPAPPPPTRQSSSPSPGHDRNHFTNTNNNEDETSLLSISFLIPTKYTF